jgi:predicted dehydrogenase
MRILLIGSGNRATAYAGYFRDDIAIIYDPDIKKPPLLIEKYNLIHASMIKDYKKADDFDAIIVASPDHTHLEVMEWAVKKKKPILLEKPVEVSLEALKKLYEIASDYKYGIVLGFGLRYTFMYSKIIELLEKGDIGRVVSIEAAETLGELHAAKFFRRWHRESRLSGGMLNTKCSHDMDIINIIANALPEKISSFGNNMLFKRKRGLLSCSKECPEFCSCIYIDENEYIFSSADPRICPFNIESDIVDHQSVNILFENGITAVFTLTMHSSKGNRTIRIHGENGIIEAGFETQEVLLECKGRPNRIYKPEDTCGSHGGGDIGLCEFFRVCHENGNFPNQLEAGILASATALAADVSRIDGSIVDFKEILNYIQGKK